MTYFVAQAVRKSLSLFYTNSIYASRDVLKFLHTNVWDVEYNQLKSHKDEEQFINCIFLLPCSKDVCFSMLTKVKILSHAYNISHLNVCLQDRMS